MKVGQLVTYTGFNDSLRNRVGVIKRLERNGALAAVDFGSTDEPVILCAAVNLTPHSGEPS